MLGAENISPFKTLSVFSSVPSVSPLPRFFLIACLPSSLPVQTHWPSLPSPPAMNGSVHDPHAHKRTSINELLNPVASSTAIDHGLASQSPSYSNGHYAQNSPYTHPTMQPPPHHRTANGAAYKLNPASWDGADHDRQRIDHMPSPRGFAPGVLPSPGAYQEYHAHLSRTHEDGFSEPSAVWPSPTGRLDGLPAYASPTITQTSYSDERTCECVPCIWSLTLLTPLTTSSYPK